MEAIVRAQEEEASFSNCAYIYDVFLSFRGEDTRKNFTDHLYTALVQAGYRTFRDDNEIEKGESLNPELCKAINGSRISIIVFSKNYTSSPWCLDELVMILECKKRTLKHVVLPVFYDVCPSEIRKQKGRTGKAFDEYMEQYEAQIDHGRKMELMEKVKGWKEALEEVADLAGMELKNQTDGHESRFIHKIINYIRGKLKRTPLFVAPYLIGMQSRAKNINKWLQDDWSNVSLLGICGMGGIGKTTMAKFIYNKNYESFDSSCFLTNVREMSQKPNGLASLQRQLLSSILNEKHEKIYNVDEGIIKIMKAISRKRVLLVIDDVDQIDQLNALRGIRDWSCRGSKIIITTRYEKLLKPHQVFKVEELGYDESIKLFNFYAFEDDHIIEGYREHTKRVVQLCGGLLLALQVIGSSLRGRTLPQWEFEMKKLEAIPHKKILDKLKISYDCLEDESDKRLFLDIACFFVGNDKDYTVKVLDSNDTYADVGIQNLIDRCLLKIDSGNKLVMHQLLQDMGRNIVNQESLEPQRRSRLWHQKEAYSVLRNKKGTATIEGLTLDMSMLIKDDNIARKRKYDEYLDKASPLTCMRSFFHRSSFFSFLLGQQISPALGNQRLHLTTDAFQKMKNLRLLKLNYTQLDGRYNNFPENLIWLCWHGFPLKYIPTELSLENLVALDLRDSKLEEVWIGCKFLGSLKILNLGYSKRLAKTPNFLGVPNLKRLILKGCISLIEICGSIEFLEELNLLDLKDCKNLKMLPRNMYKLGSLETLIISGCSTLFAGGNDISGISTPNGQGKWWLTSLLMPWVPLPRKGLEILWTSLPCSLTGLNLSNCNLSNDSLPCEFSNLSLLKDLDLSFNSFHCMPDCITSLSSLQSLSLSFCESLDSIFGLPSNLKRLDVNDCLLLRKITFQSDAYQLLRLETHNYRKIIEIEGIFKREPIGKVDRRIVNNLGIDIESIKNLEVLHLGVSFFMKDRIQVQGIYEYGIFSTFIPGGEIPNGFSERKKGSVISLILPLLPKLRIQCFNICYVYARTGFSKKPYYYTLGIKINNKTKDLTWMYCPMVFGIPEGDKEMTWLSQWNFGNQLEGGDEIVISFLMGDVFEVKECGIKIVCEKDNGVVSDDNIKTYFHRNEVIGGDLSRLQLSTGSYLLYCLNYRAIKFWRPNLLIDFVEVAELEEIQKRELRGGPFIF